MNQSESGGDNQFALTRTISRATTTLLPHQFESVAIEFYGKVVAAAGIDDDYTVQFTSASDAAQFMVALRSFARP